MKLPGRILYICHDGQVYGSQQSLLLILRHLPGETYRAFASLARGGPLAETIKKLSQERGGNITLSSHKRLQWVKHDPRTRLRNFGDVLGLLILALPRAFKLVSEIRKHRINLVHTNSVVSLEGAIAARIAGVPHIWHIRELFMTDNPKLFMILGKTLSRRIIHHLSARVFCISEAVRNQFGPYLEMDPEKYVLLYNALETPAENASSSHRHPVEKPYSIGYIGRLSEGKRFHDLLEAAAILKAKGHTFELQVAGSFVDAAYENRIKTMLAWSGLADCVKMLGYRDNLHSLYQSLDLLVVPSYNEPFGRVVIEAMMHGVPCVGAESGGIPEIITHDETGWMYPVKDPKALAAVLDDLMRRPERLGPVRENARRMVRDRFTIEGQIGKLDACYQEILQGK